jgi:subtilase family serine protease
MVRRTALFLLTIVAILSVATTNSQAQDALTHHVRDVTRTGEARPVGNLSANRILQLDIVLPLRDQEGMDLLLQQIYDPTSPYYRQFLTVPEFTERFGPTEVDYDSVVSWATRNGFAVVGGTRDGMDVQIRGRVSDIETAFHVNMRTYQHPTENRTFYAPDREPTTDLPFSLWHVSGLDNFSIPHPMLVNRNTYAAAHGMDPANVVSHATTGSGPSASFLGSDMRSAYYGGTTLTGAGQNLGLLEFVGTDLADLATYYTNVGQTRTVPITLLSTDGTSVSCVSSSGCDDTEQTLDMTQALGMAPGLASLVVYVGSSDTAMISAMTTHNPLPATIGCSWGWTPADPITLDPYFKKMAMQGQNFLTASGDNSTWTTFGKSEAWPADNAYVVSVGGTDLITASAGGPWKSETAWSNSGGGISPDGIPIPAWQLLSGVINSTNKGSMTLRNGPDVSANANFTFYVCADQTTCSANLYGGTSFAAPMWAGYIALVNQQLAASSSPTIGFINPTIYAQNITSQYTTDFHDITSGTSGSYSAVVGYDLVTGWGSPNGVNLINALAPTTPDFTISASPSSASVVQGNSGSSTITVGISGGFSSAVALSATGQPTGVTVSFVPSSIASPGSGTSTMTMAVASTTATGTYPITVTGSGGGLMHSTTVTLTVNPVPTPDFTISASPASVTVSLGNSGTSTVTVAISGGFSSAVALSATGQPTGVTVGFVPASIASPGSGTSTMTMTVASTTATGTYPITVTGSGGGLMHSTTVTLTVSSASPDFSLFASPTSVTIPLSSQGTSTITVTPSGGFTGSVHLSATGVPSGVSTSFNPNPTTGTSTLFFRSSATATLGTFTVTVHGASGALNHTTTVTLTVGSASPDFTISASPASASVVQGNSGSSTITVGISGGFSSAVALSATGQPTGVTVSFVPTSIPSPGSGTSSMTMAVASTTATGTYPITVTGSGGGLMHSTTVTLTVTPLAVPNFTISASPASASVVQGNSGSSTITVDISGGFSSAVALSATGQPTGVTVGFTPTPIPSPGSGTSSMTVAVPSTTATGTYPITVTGSGGGLMRSTTFTLTVTPATVPDFTISASPASASVALGSSGTSTVTVAVSGGFSSAVALSATGQPTGVTVGFVPASISAPGSGTSTMTMTVASTTATGTYPITVTGSGGGLMHSTTVTLTVTSTAVGDFTLSASPTSVTIPVSAQGTSTITVIPSGGFTGSVHLSATGVPTGVTTSFNPNPTTGTSTLFFRSTASASLGTFTVTVHGASGTLNHTVTVSLTVN